MGAQPIRNPLAILRGLAIDISCNGLPGGCLDLWSTISPAHAGVAGPGREKDPHAASREDVGLPVPRKGSTPFFRKNIAQSTCFFWLDGGPTVIYYIYIFHFPLESQLFEVRPNHER